MPARLRFLTSPIHLTGRLTRGQVVTLLAADVLVRRARAEGQRASWVPASLTGDLGVQQAVERELARHGLARTSLTREAFVERARAHEERARQQAQAGLAALGVDVDLDEGTCETEEVVRGARTAFVRLYEAGLVSQAERVVDWCTRCATVIETADTEAVKLPAQRLTVRLPLAPDGTLDVDLIAPELLPGAVAVAVPEGHEQAGSQARLPLVVREVPVVAEPGREEPTLLVPAHDPAAHDVCRGLGLSPRQVIGPDGVVGLGPLEGLARYAARDAATRLLAAEGGLVGVAETVEPGARCRRCSSTLLPLLGAHWFLAFGELQQAAADAVRDGAVAFTPPISRRELVGRTESPSWCLSRQLWAGQALPVATCADCGQTAVAVDIGDSCGKCMGRLVAAPEVFDARFVGTVWPLVAAGWPSDDGGPAALASSTTLVVGPRGMATWALPMAALGLRLSATVPFSRVALQEVAEPGEALDLVELVAAEGRRVGRVALLADVAAEEARQLVANLDDPRAGEADIEALARSCAESYRSGTPGAALSLLRAATREGVRPEATDRVRALAAPILGD